MVFIVCLTALFAAFYVGCVDKDSVALTVAGGGLHVTVHTAQSDNTVELWRDETAGISWFFLPSCVRHHRIRLDDSGMDSVRVDGKLVEQGDVWTWEEGRTYEIRITDEAYETQVYDVAFMRSENIPAIFINTASGSMAYLEEDKEHEEAGDICVVREDGSTEYRSTLEKISGRGNSTWEYAKKPYTIKLSAEFPLCGLDSGKRWRLLALWREGSKLDNKIAMDMAEELGLSYSAQGTWIDLYLNGQYAGIYLLAESVSVDQGRVDITDLEKENERYNEDIDHAERYEEEDNKGYRIENGPNITGGYLIEKDHPKHYSVENGGFVTSFGNQFTVQAPKHVSQEQVQYIQDWVEDIEQMAQNGDPAVWNYLELDSFAKRFLIDEISMNTDAGLTSMYFYKERDDDKLYSGPAWDYDNAFGAYSADAESASHDYEHSILDYCASLPNRLRWYAALYETSEMRQRVIEEYMKILPFMEDVLENKIDEYAQRIRVSVQMDQVRWNSELASENFANSYVSYDANVRYMKYFIANRLNWLGERWGVEHELFMIPSNEEMHTVTFANYEGVIDTIEIPDGEELLETPEYDASIYQGWVNQYTGEKYRRQIPILEDTVYYNAKWE